MAALLIGEEEEMEEDRAPPSGPPLSLFSPPLIRVSTCHSVGRCSLSPRGLGHIPYNKSHYVVVPGRRMSRRPIVADLSPLLPSAV